METVGYRSHPLRQTASCPAASHCRPPPAPALRQRRQPLTVAAMLRVMTGRWHFNAQGFVLLDFVAQSPDGDLEIPSSAGAASAVISECPHDELALDIFDCVAHEPRNDQLVEAA